MDLMIKETNCLLALILSIRRYLIYKERKIILKTRLYWRENYRVLPEKSVNRNICRGSQVYTSSISKFTNSLNCCILLSISVLLISFNLVGPNFSTQKLAIAEPTMIPLFIFSNDISPVLAK